MTGIDSRVVTTEGEEGRRAVRRPSEFLELELVDVLDRERVRRSKDDLRLPIRALDDHVVAELAGLERLTDLARDLAAGERGDSVAGEVPEVFRVPELERLHRAVVDVGLHLARQTETRQHHLVLVPRVREVLRGGGNPDRRRRLD